MSKRGLRIIHSARLNLVFTIVVVLIAGCERTGIVSQPEAEIPATADPKIATSEPAELATEAPLLLEDGPDSGTPAESAADNSRCFVCHMNYMQEELAIEHAQTGIGCAKCHGPSDAHIADESWGSGGNGTAPDIMYPRDKINASCLTCHPRDKLDTPQHQAALATTPLRVCTDCHGKHRLPQRRCKWK